MLCMVDWILIYKCKAVTEATISEQKPFMPKEVIKVLSPVSPQNTNTRTKFFSGHNDAIRNHKSDINYAKIIKPIKKTK